jgi:hypothetical protein
MPIFAPRSESTKKEEELSKRKQELKYAIQKSYPTIKLSKVIEKYRTAQLSLLKAKIHIIREKEFQSKPHSLKADKIEENILIWKNKPAEEIVAEFNQ